VLLLEKLADGSLAALDVVDGGQEESESMFRFRCTASERY
jgi:hypothetical protein